MPQEGDSQVVVPSIISLVADSQLPPRVTVTANQLAESSVLFSFSRTKTNGVAIDTDLLIIPPGLYNLQIELAARFNYTLSALAPPDALVFLTVGGVSVNLAGLYSFIGTQAKTFTHKLLLLQQGLIVLRDALNGVAQTIDVSVVLNLTRKI